MATQKKKAEVKMNKVIELTQNSAKAALDGAVGTAEATENYIQTLYKAGYDANVDGLKVAKGYWDATTEIRKDWVKLISKTGEKVIDGKMKMEMPYQKEAMNFGKDMYNSISKTVSSFMPQTKSAK